ncbi:glycosyl hydrolase family 61-domain-containing protein [Crassisporium funariophilum]|nr:glycosyl hydrolase family 61-domain-containing protein [Crassisporium funariophilum]
MRLHLAPIATVAFIASRAAAHSTFQQLWINDVDAGSSCIRAPVSNSPVTSVSGSDIACNTAGTSQGVCPVKAGDKLTVEMHAQPGQRSCANEAIGGNHYGPVTVYMAAVSDAKSASGTSAGWFKVSEMGLVSNNPDYFAVQVLNNNCGHYTFTVPSDIAPGNYLLRAEVIALHVAGSAGGAQFYPACYQINVSGSGTAKPPTVKFPGAYGASDPGILVNIHQDLSTYKIPGPAPYGTAPATVGTVAYPTTATWDTSKQPSTVPTVVPGAPTSAPTTPVGGGGTTTPPAQTTQPSGGASVPLYGQCGGNGWTGGTTCSQGTCKASSEWYSQCLP